MACLLSSGGLIISLVAFGTVEHHIHRKRRAANMPVLSMGAIRSAEDMIKAQVEKLCTRFQAYSKSGMPVELRTQFIAFTTDTIALHSLGQSLGLQDDENKAKDWNLTIRAVAKLTPLVKQFPWALETLKKIPVKIFRLISVDLARLLQYHHVSPDLHMLSSISRQTKHVVWLGHAGTRTPVSKGILFHD